MGGREIESTEGTTQGGPLAIAMYALAITPLIQNLKEEEPGVKQVWFAYDATAAGRLRMLLQWWQHLTTIHLKMGYFPKAFKTHLVAKPDHLEEAHKIFAGTDVRITTQGQSHLVSFAGD